MILLWFALGTLLAYGIARYNESNKLFWQLFLAFVLGFTATVVCNRAFHSEERSNDNLTQVCPTQVLYVVQGNAYYPTRIDITTPLKVTGSELVSQDITPVLNEVEVASSEVFGRTRDQPIQTIIQPPEC